ncbi:hypothetical protein [Hanstruepera flava]|uniref:hypothetical protein n=1 Tax=Hanstruepera flava TaxID=2930218 RepID=UPI002027E8AE|nr:hypothetical protein [Hanstruepera flava]
MDTIYGNPKSVREKVEFLNEKKQNYKFMQNDGDYGHALIFTPENIRETFKCNWVDSKGCFYVNYKKEFLKNGLPDNEIWYNKDGSFKREYKYTYDKNNNLVETKELYWDDVHYLTRYFYNKSNLLISESRYWSDDPNDFVHLYFIRGYKGKIIGVNSFDEDGSRDIITYEIDSIENTINEYHQRVFNYTNEDSFKVRDSIGKKFLLKKSKFDDFENKVYEEHWIEENSKRPYKTIYEYDERNNLIYEGYARDTVYAYRKYKYDLDDRKISYEYSVVKNSSSKELVNYKYDEKGYIIKVLCHFREKEYTIDYKYKFDKKGNWTEITKIVNGEPLYVWTRDIKYY